jgi:hypothetical protein
MMLYADEDFPYPVVEELRRLGHDVGYKKMKGGIDSCPSLPQAP